MAILSCYIVVFGFFSCLSVSLSSTLFLCSQVYDRRSGACTQFKINACTFSVPLLSDLGVGSIYSAKSVTIMIHIETREVNKIYERSDHCDCSAYILMVLSAPPVISRVPVMSNVEQNTPASASREPGCGTSSKF